MYTVLLDEAAKSEVALVGGKALALASLLATGEQIPRSLCITTKAYDKFLDQCNLREKIALELSRKQFSEMRWEEIWDTALRIRKLFVNTPLPDDMATSIGREITAVFDEQPVALRSSSPDEDTAKASFAGLHESFINIAGKKDILEHVKKVWASLWSDAALLYRQEKGLTPQKSSIAVLVQEVIASEVSGVMFSRSPDANGLTVIEAVYGLNQGLVDGTIEPDRWHVRIEDRTVVTHHGAERESRVMPDPQGTSIVQLPKELKNKAPLTPEQVVHLTGRAVELENHFGSPQDIEWTFTGLALYILQSRPITTGKEQDSDDKRPWYLSQHRSLENLQALQTRISEELLPAMDAEARELALLDIQNFDDQGLADEIRRRIECHVKWIDVYWTDFIPFAHGMRLFGEIYNDKVKPEDPYEFVSLLSRGSLASIRRNDLLSKLGEMAGSRDEIRQLLMENRSDEIVDQQFLEGFQELRHLFGELHLSLGDHNPATADESLVGSLILRMAEHPFLRDSGSLEITRQKLENQFLAAFAGPEEKERAHELLELGRASYTLRDDDNIYLGRIEQQLNRTLKEARTRLQERQQSELPEFNNETVIACLEDPKLVPEKKAASQKESSSRKDKRKETTRARQLLGQPAGPGIARGKARVVTEPAHLQNFQRDEILVCDSIDPNMTFIVPLAAGIVERRGGMLIHGAIIAREYGIACVTGIPDATDLIETGDTVTVDGYLGIVTIGHAKDPLA